MQRDIARIVGVVCTQSGLATPIKPATLAAWLRLELQPRIGAAYSMRQNTIVFDPTSPDQHTWIAHGCAQTILRRVSDIKTSPISAGALADALCGDAEAQVDMTIDVVSNPERHIVCMVNVGRAS